MPSVEATCQDLRFALRSWAKAPAFAIAAVATLALGIGATTAMFSIVSGVLLRPLPFIHPDQLVQVYETQPRDGTRLGFDGPVVYQDFDEWRSQSRLFTGLVTYMRSGRTLQGAGHPEQIAAVAAERGLFALLGVSPFLGRTFEPGDPMDVAVVSYGFWKDHLGADRSIAGRRVTLDGASFAVIGVMPEGFQFPYRPASAAVWDAASTPALWIPWQAPADLRAHPAQRRLDAVVGRLEPGVRVEDARRELSSMTGPAGGGRIVRVRPLMDVVGGPVRTALLTLLGAAAMVLLIACVNVTNLFLARTASRVGEISLRAALGASRGRLMRQLATEGLLLAGAAGAAGLAIGMWLSGALIRLASAQIPRAGEIGLDWRVFGFVLVASVTIGIGVGLAPAIGAARGTAAMIRTGGPRSAFRDALVVVEIALAFVLLAGAGLLVRTFVHLQHTNPGLDAHNVVTAHVVVSDARESMALEQRAARIPGVRAAGLISLLPLQNSGWSGGFRIPGRPDVLESELRYVTPGYFRAMGIPLGRGRGFSARDTRDRPAVILVNEALARRYFPQQDPVGRLTDRGTIIGVVGEVRQSSLAVPPAPEIYYSVAQNFAQIRQHGSTLVVRADVPASALVAAIRAAVQDVLPGQAVFRIETMEGVIERSLATPRLHAWLLGWFAALGTLLAMTGVYGVLAYLVTLRTREFGIRLALGAGPGRVLRLVLGRGVFLAGAGLAFGLGLAVAFTRVLQGALYGVAPADPATFGLMATALSLAACAACVVPALRASRVDPSVALRHE